MGDEGETGTVPLSVLFDRMASTVGPDDHRDQHFVRAFTAWLQREAAHLTLGLPAHYALEDVVATFHMRDRVKLVVTGYPAPPHVGNVTLEFDEREFTRVMVTVHAEPVATPYEFCTLDYFAAGARVAIASGPHASQRGTVQVAATIGLKRQLRIQLDGGRSVTVDADHAVVEE